MAIFGRSKKKAPPTGDAHGPRHTADWSPQSPIGQTNGSPPPNWAMTPPPPYQPYQTYQPVFVSNNFILPPPPSQLVKKGCGKGNKLKSASAVNLPLILANEIQPRLPPQFFQDGIPAWHRQGTQFLNQGAALYDLISSKFNNVVTSIDGERFSGNERELYLPEPQGSQQRQPPIAPVTSKDVVKHKSKPEAKADLTCSLANVGKNYFAKVHLYANSKLPSNLTPARIYVEAYPLICLAARYAERVYNKPIGAEREAHINPDWRLGTKAMVIKSVPMDRMNVIVFAIRGSATFMDWAVNLNDAPASPQGFLDDAGNFVHNGFLQSARRMIPLIAARLRNLLEQNPERASSALLITGHSAGGAVAALIYCHMLSTRPETQSELNILTGCFRRIHCITFGAPPVSLLPLQTPPGPAEQKNKSMFLGFVNEGDPVARAEKKYIRSLLDLYAAPAPVPVSAPKVDTSAVGKGAAKARVTGVHGSKSASTLTVNKVRPSPPIHSRSSPAAGLGDGPIWHLPSATLSNAGQLVLLREVPRVSSHTDNGKGKSEKKKAKKQRDEVEWDDEGKHGGVQARWITDELLRSVVWGDPVQHMMAVYTRRVEGLAVRKVVGRS